jgi:GTP-binding protein YchF
VVRAFAEEAVPHPLAGVNPRRDLETLVQELLLADLEVVERRLERVEKDLARGKRELDREHRVLLRCREALGEERGVRSLTWSHEEDELLRGFAFLTAKPALVVANVGEEGLPAEEEGTLREAAASRRMPFATLEARLEVELSGLEEAERRAFRESYGLADTARDLLVRTAYEALDSHTFYTAGEHEVRAWALRRGGTALEAAGTVHTDMARGFIRAEVIHIDEFLACGSVAAAREKGLYRLEGKDYVLKDGDLVYFRFSK